MNSILNFFIDNKPVTFLLLLGILFFGIIHAPFDWQISWLERDPVPVDAIPDIGENQQIVFTEWSGRSPEDIEDQITYPLTTTLMGIPGIKTVRSSSMFGFSTIYLIFEEDVEFYWSRSRILEKLNALPLGLLPDNVTPQLGPDATALGQIFWYTLEGRNEEGQPSGGWDPQELRSIQDFYVKYGLSSASGVSEVASIGGYVKEYQIDLDPLKMRTYKVSIGQVIDAVRNSNLDIGARTLEINRAEYFIRGLGYIKSLDDIRKTVVKSVNEVPIHVEDVAFVTIGPKERRGILDKSGAEAVGGVVVARYGANPLEVINNVKQKIEELSPGLPSKILKDGETSKVTVVPFYDRTQLIQETLGTLEHTLYLEILITILVIILMLRNLRVSFVVSGLLPVAVLGVFILMKYTGIQANIVALSGIAIAIGTMVDLGILMSENIYLRIQSKPENESISQVVKDGAKEVAPAIITAVSTTIISFIPVFALQSAEGKLFAPLAYTKTFALLAAVVFAILFIPLLMQIFFKKGSSSSRTSKIIIGVAIMIVSVLLLLDGQIFIGTLGLILGILNGLEAYFHFPFTNQMRMIISILIVAIFLTDLWLPLGPQKSFFSNILFVGLITGLLLFLFWIVIKYYSQLLKWCLENRLLFLTFITFILISGLVIWRGFDGIFGFAARSGDAVGLNIRKSVVWSSFVHRFPGVGKEFMPALDEGSFLLMPTSMPHAGVEENRRTLALLDMAVNAIPEVEMVVGKAGRVNSPLDPAPLSMFENVILYKSEYIQDKDGSKVRFRKEDGEFVRDENGDLIRDKKGEYYRQWRDHIETPNDIWNEISRVTQLPGVTGAPKLQPIETRLVMLRTGMRSPMGIKVKGPDLETIEAFGIALENVLKQVPLVKKSSVFAERIVGKPYLIIDLDRLRLARYGLSIKEVQQYLSVSVGGIALTSTVEGRERYPIRVRYPRELRDNPDAIKNILIPISSEMQIPLSEIADVRYERGPQNIKSEDTFLTGYVLFDKVDAAPEGNVINSARNLIESRISEGTLIVPSGVSYSFSGTYENQLRAEKRLALLIPLVLLVIMTILYMHFRSFAIAMMVFSGVAVAFAGGFILIGLYNSDWFLNFNLFNIDLRKIFSVSSINLSVAVWVGFIALFGIATDDGVVMASYLKSAFKNFQSSDKTEIIDTIIKAGSRRVRPCLMTTATTLLALLPVLTSTGRGSDIMIPMAIPIFGGMAIEIITMFLVPVLFSIWKEKKLAQ